MTQTYYTKEHEYIKVDGDTGTVGITDYAQKQLGDIVFVELPEVGRSVSAGDDMAVVESVKAASDVYAPVAGEIVETNADLEASPDMVNSSAETKAWFVKMRLGNPAELEDLMDEAAYKSYLETLG